MGNSARVPSSGGLGGGWTPNESCLRAELTCGPAVRFWTRVSRRLWSSSSREWICCRSRLGWTTSSSAGGSLPSALTHSLRPAGWGGDTDTTRFSANSGALSSKCLVPAALLWDQTADGGGGETLLVDATIARSLLVEGAG